MDSFVRFDIDENQENVVNYGFTSKQFKINHKTI